VTCDGASPDCPEDAKKPANTECRAAAGECDVPEVCDGSSAACPADAFKPTDTACTDDGNPCTRDVCTGSR
jgi:hypothetical protein